MYETGGDMTDDVLKDLLENGVHFGHQTRRWNPRMKRFIFGERSGIYIIDLEKTRDCLAVARDFLNDIAAKGGKVLFVGTKKQAQDVIAAEAQRAEMPYINRRWMGGLLTNFETVMKSLDKLKAIEKKEADGILANLKKKEVATINKEREKLLRDLGGIREMSNLPKAVFIVDAGREDIAVREANKLKIPIIALIDTNCDPDVVDYPIPGNDDALKSIRFITRLLTDGIVAGRKEFTEQETIQKKTQSAVKKTKAEKSRDVAAESSASPSGEDAENVAAVDNTNQTSQN